MSANAIGFAAGAGLPAGFRVFIFGTNLSYDSATGLMSVTLAVFPCGYSGPQPSPCANDLAVQNQNAATLAQDISPSCKKRYYVQTETFSAWGLQSQGLTSFGATAVISDTLATWSCWMQAGRIGYLRLHGSGSKAHSSTVHPPAPLQSRGIELARGWQCGGWSSRGSQCGWTLANFNYAARHSISQCRKRR